MGTEIERKFLVKNGSYKKLSHGVYYKQGYLSTEKEKTIRVRIYDNKGFITIKGKTNGISRLEYEYKIPPKDAEEILNFLCGKLIIEKYRYHYKYQGFLWEIDEFLGDNEGLVVAEIELPDENQEFCKPGWIGKEVTQVRRYSNASLVKNPYKNWKK